MYFRGYLQSLDPKHSPPDNIKINRIIEVLIDAGVLEFVKICNDRRKLLRHGFISSTTDFVTDPHRKQSFGVLLLDLVAEKYELRDGRTLFMSRETAKKINDLLLTVSEDSSTFSVLSEATYISLISFISQGFSNTDMLEYVANFEHYKLPNTIENVVGWMQESVECVKVVSTDSNQMAADGASNAIGSILEVEVQTRDQRDNDVDLSICCAHQNERAGGYASGTHKHAVPVNEALGSILEKSHTIQVRVNRAESRMDVLRDIQKNRNRNPILTPKPCNDTRWNGRHDETTFIMGDMCLTLDMLLGPNGDDHDLLTANEKETENYDRLCYTNDDKMVLRQFEATSADAKQFSLFTQEKGNTNAYLLFQIQMVLQRTRRDSFEMAEGMNEPCHSVEYISLTYSSLCYYRCFTCRHHYRLKVAQGKVRKSSQTWCRNF